MKKFKFTISGKPYEVEVQDIEGNIATVNVNGTEYKVEMEEQAAPVVAPVARPAAKAAASTSLIFIFKKMHQISCVWVGLNFWHPLKLCTSHLAYFTLFPAPGEGRPR